MKIKLELFSHSRPYFTERFSDWKVTLDKNIDSKRCDDQRLSFVWFGFLVQGTCAVENLLLEQFCSEQWVVCSLQYIFLKQFKLIATVRFWTASVAIDLCVLDVLMLTITNAAFVLKILDMNTFYWHLQI